jgi:hypothetical protein
VKYLFCFAVIRNGDFTCCVVFRALNLSACLQNNTCFFCPGEVPLRYITVPVKDNLGNIEMKSLVFEYCHLVVCVLRLLGLASAICLCLRAFQQKRCFMLSYYFDDSIVPVSLCVSQVYATLLPT